MKNQGFTSQKAFQKPSVNFELVPVKVGKSLFWIEIRW